MNKFKLIFLETDRRIIVLAGVMQEKMFDFSAERFGLGNNFLFHLISFLKLSVLLQIIKIVDLELELLEQLSKCGLLSEKLGISLISQSFIIILLVKLEMVSHDVNAFLEEFDVLLYFVLIVDGRGLLWWFLGWDFLGRGFGKKSPVSSDLFEVSVDKLFLGQRLFFEYFFNTFFFLNVILENSEMGLGFDTPLF